MNLKICKSEKSLVPLRGSQKSVQTLHATSVQKSKVLSSPVTPTYILSEIGAGQIKFILSLLLG